MDLLLALYCVGEMDLADEILCPAPRDTAIGGDPANGAHHTPVTVRTLCVDDVDPAIATGGHSFCLAPGDSTTGGDHDAAQTGEPK